jgi:tetratricopeptide (TPR) repeat protein
MFLISSPPCVYSQRDQGCFMKRLLAAAGVSLFVLSSPTLARADDPPPPPAAPKKAGPPAQPWKLKQQRQALFVEGQKLIEQGQPREALEKLLQVEELGPHPRVLLWIALAEEQLGHLLKARAIYTQAQANAREEKLADVEQDATKALDDIAPKIPHIAVHVTPPSETVIVTLDSVNVALVNGHLDVEPGKHVVLVSAPGRVSYHAEVELKAGEEKVVEASLPGDAPPPPPPPPPQPPGGGCAGCGGGGGGGNPGTVAFAAMALWVVRKGRRRR